MLTSVSYQSVEAVVYTNRNLSNHLYTCFQQLCLNPMDVARISKSDGPFLNFSPLYGEPRQRANIRQIDGRGMLRPDTFAENRTAHLQPAVSALLIVWNRNHNVSFHIHLAMPCSSNVQYLAHNLFIRLSFIKQWHPPEYFAKNSPPMRDQDDKIFNAAMKMNCTQFRNSICKDVLKGLFGLSDFDPSPELDVLAVSLGEDLGWRKRSHCCPQAQDKLGHANSQSSNGHELLTRIESTLLYPVSFVSFDCPTNPEFGLVEPSDAQAGRSNYRGQFQRQCISSSRHFVPLYGHILTPKLSPTTRHRMTVCPAPESLCRSAYLIYMFEILTNLFLSLSLYRTLPNGQVQPLVRNETTSLYDDDDVASVIMEARERPAGPPGSGSTARSYSEKADTDALEKEDTQKMCTFNEFRSLYGLQRKQLSLLPVSLSTWCLK